MIKQHYLLTLSYQNFSPSHLSLAWSQLTDYFSPLDARYNSYAAREKETQEESRLLTFLMENYDREVRPVYNASHTVEVKVGITLTQIFDMVSWSLLKIEKIIRL